MRNDMQTSEKSQKIIQSLCWCPHLIENVTRKVEICDHCGGLINIPEDFWELQKENNATFNMHSS
jgi:hypothetical protein